MSVPGNGLLPLCTRTPPHVTRFSPAKTTNPEGDRKVARIPFFTQKWNANSEDSGTAGGHLLTDGHWSRLRRAGVEG